MADVVFSAKFKRDYVAALAVILFFLIVIGEVVLAISIPMYLRQENALAVQVQRVRMLEEFDQARYIRYQTKPVNDIAAAEARLVNWNLDQLANYLRVEANRLNSDEIAALHRNIKAMTSILLEIQQNRFFCREQKIDPSFFLNSQLFQQK